MASGSVDMERFDAAVKSMTDIDISKETAERVLCKLLILYDNNWEHIEADNYRTLADAIFDEPDPTEGKKKRAEKNLDLDRCNKKPKVKEHGQKPKSNFHNKGNKEYDEVPHQQGEKALNRKAVRTQLPRPSTQYLKETKTEISLGEAAAIDESTSALPFESQNKHNLVAAMLPQVLGPIPHRDHEGAHMISGLQHAASQKFQSASVSQEGLMADARRSQAPVCSKNSSKRQCHDVNDIAKGQERVRIPIVTSDNEALPPPFHYITQNITAQDAYVNLSLARIGDENCCSECFGDCLAAPLPCACASETGGEFAYTRDGLLKKEFLDACVSVFKEPDKHPHFYCKICPLEKIKIDQKSDSPKAKVNPDPCKGHIMRKFIKECWRKCGCTRNCGNRVVQRGIIRSLQVFLTPEGKGWGVRTAEKLPPGAFICEFVGEILTNTELYERNMQKTGNEKHTYPLNLNADWGTEGVLKDDEALCLDGTFYGNVARFINHRCFDGNLVGIPVEIETPDRHYYHLAFFTKREVEPYEELTWDYEIDFDDVDHPIKAFKCFCGSKYCRDKKRKSRSKK